MIGLRALSALLAVGVEGRLTARSPSEPSTGGLFPATRAATAARACALHCGSGIRIT